MSIAIKRKPGGPPGPISRSKIPKKNDNKIRKLASSNQKK
jgi:hypothetical protein